MKGPGLRIDLDVRRIWRCSKCGKTARTVGHVTAQRCGCSEESPWMRLEQPPKRAPFEPPQREPLPESEEVAEPTPAPSEQPPAELVKSAPLPSIAEISIAEAEVIPPDSQNPVTPEGPPPADEFGAGLAQP